MPIVASPDHVLHARIEALAATLDEHVRETRLLYAALALRPPGPVANPPTIAGGPGEGVLNSCIPCRQDAFAEPWFSYWTNAFHAQVRHHRKLWEFVFICQALWERGALRDDSRGLGFGVGTEPLAALFASRGCQIVGSDMSPDRMEAAGWAETMQHAAGKSAMRHPYLCDDAVFDRNVSFRTCDMNDVPEDLTDFDFCWSSCALEHLGSLEHGLRFIERSIDCLKPGGWAIHTTEYNFGSNDDTVDHMGTVLYRRSDFEALRDRLAAKGHVLAPLDFDIGSGPADTYLDVPPYRQEPCLKIALMGHATTSYGLIVRRAL
ncbi:MAG: class I SAM-dependent methyltransferase [Brevundimonas sp.]|uniref:class I SAM-dependent methyltransferase n=1 Tax=Brevundimonas sp. TaxID=1871086 RepID=UPI0027333BB5|nr:class I SAM-dependent methyltransferase [Brevundimonas sp.]MDP3403802.1 class I SAM-dependent methyltransferase [Brevundimonas sp.]